MPPFSCTNTMSLFECTGFQRAFCTNLRQNFCHNACIAPIEISTFTAANRIHLYQGKTIILHRQISRGMGPIFKNLLRFDQRIQMLWLIVRHTVPQHMMMRPFNHSNGINLHITQLPDHLQSPHLTCNNIECRT